MKVSRVTIWMRFAAIGSVLVLVLLPAPNGAVGRSAAAEPEAAGFDVRRTADLRFCEFSRPDQLSAGVCDVYLPLPRTKAKPDADSRPEALAPPETAAGGQTAAGAKMPRPLGHAAGRSSW